VTELAAVEILIGTSGWSYPSWRPGFYPAGLQPGEFLSYYASQFQTVELNTTAYRLPSAEQFERWGGAVPTGFRFAPKLALARPGRIGAYLERVAGLGKALGPIRVVIQSTRDDALLAAVLEAAAGRELAFDFRHDSWAGSEGIVAVNDFEAEPFRYIRLREPPYSQENLEQLAKRLRPPAYVFFRHEDEPTAPAYAARLGELLSGAAPPPA
jgi:uncharacterized protein YecE (DUF72 family)